MRARSIGWCLGLAIMVLAGAISFGQDGNDSQESGAELVIGDNYTVAAERHGVAERYSGDLVKANDRWIVLHCASEGRHDRAIPVLSKFPLIGHRFHGTAVGRSDELVWIPREAANIEKRAPMTTRNKLQPPTGDSPPPRTACAVQFVSGGKVGRREGGIEDVTDEQLTISMPTKVKVTPPVPNTAAALASLTSAVKINRYETRYVREEFSLTDVLCVRVASSDTTALHRPHDTSAKHAD